MAGYRERDFSIHIPEPKPERMDNAVLAGWICLAFTCVLPMFSLGSIACGIMAILRDERKSGILILCLTPVAILVGVIIFMLITTVFSFSLTSWLMGDVLKNMPQVPSLPPIR